jgi:hypothetical protein
MKKEQSGEMNSETRNELMKALNRLGENSKYTNSSLSIETYLKKCKSVSKEYIKTIENRLDEKERTMKLDEQSGEPNVYNDILNYYGPRGLMKTPSNISNINIESIRTIIKAYYITQGLNLGYVDGLTPLNGIEILLDREEIIDIFLLTQGGTFDETLFLDEIDKWSNGIYSKLTWMNVVESTRYLLRYEPDFIGSRNININRETILDELEIF